MPDKLKEIKCCNQAVLINRDAVHPDTKEKGVGIWCDKCGINAIHENEKTAIEMIKEDIAQKEKGEQKAGDKQEELDLSREKDLKPIKDGKRTTPRYDNVKKENKKVNKPQLQDTALMIVPKNPGELENYLQNNQTHLIEITSPVVGEKSAMLRLINNNMRYVQLASQLKKCWETQEGQESIIHETEEALMMGAELGKMGDLVPFGAVCQFIPSVEAFEFALTNGKNAPFEWIKIECVYEGDQIRSGRKDGDFFIDFESFGDRLKVVKVFVYGLERKSSNIIGEPYSAERLLEKASVHSTPYKNYLKIMSAFEYAKSEGKTSIDENGRESFTYYVIKEEDQYFENDVAFFKQEEKTGHLKGSGKNQYAVQVINKKGGGTWDKKIYRNYIEGGKEEKTIYIDDLTNPYAGPDQPEMLRKSAGKSFLGKYAKVRNSEAAMDEVRTHKKTVDRAFNLADEYMGE